MILNRPTNACLNLIITPLVLALLSLLMPLLITFRLIYFSAVAPFFNRNHMIPGKVVLITGASSGIGEKMSYEYAKKRACLVIVDVRKRQLLEVGERARELGSPDVLTICADVSSFDDCKAFIDQTIHHFGRLDHLVNNAGIASVCKFEDATDIGSLKSLMDVNLWGSIYPTLLAIPHLKRTKGKIFAASSSCAFMHPPTMSCYTASKAALLGFFECVRRELGASSVTVTIGTLGFVESEMTTGKLLPDKDGHISLPQLLRPILKVVPMVKVGEAGKAIVDGICRGERNVTEPSCFWVLHLLNFCLPQLFDSSLHLLFTNNYNNLIHT